MDKTESEVDQIKRELQTHVNSDGYGFQYSVIKEIDRMTNTGESAFSFEVAEYPVDLKGRPTHIDFILRKNMFQAGYTPQIIVECKRANPALKNWCFIRAPFSKPEFIGDFLYVETLTWNDKIDQVLTTVKSEYLPSDYFSHIGYEVKAKEKGDARSRPEAIKDAINQVIQGLNGLIDFYNINPSTLQRNHRVLLFPAVMTTARLWFSEVDLTSADLETGNIDLVSAGFHERKWLLFQANISPGLQHSCGSARIPGNLREAREVFALRTVAIVNQAGIKDFLNWASRLSETFFF